MKEITEQRRFGVIRLNLEIQLTIKISEKTEQRRFGVIRLNLEIQLKGHCHEHNFKNSTAQKHVYTIRNLLTVVRFY